jgi:hypothetical protein
MSSKRERESNSILMALGILTAALLGSSVVAPATQAFAQDDDNEDNHGQGLNQLDDNDDESTDNQNVNQHDPNRTVNLWAVPTHSRVDDGHYQLLKLKFRLDMINSIDEIKVTLDKGTPGEKTVIFEADGTVIFKDPAFVSVTGETKLKTDGYYAIMSAKGKFIIAIDKTQVGGGFHTALAEIKTDMGTFSDDAFFILKSEDTSPADLVANFLDSQSSLKKGKEYDTSAVESNNGGKADKHMVRIYLSTNSVLDNTDTEIGSNDVNHVAKGEFKTTHVKIEIPSNAGTGSAYLILKIDADNSITESNEANNTIAKSITVTS